MGGNQETQEGGMHPEEEGLASCLAYLLNSHNHYYCCCCCFVPAFWPAVVADRDGAEGGGGDGTLK